MTEFTPIESTIGGVLIGLSAVLLMGLHGRIAGMTGILGGIIPPLASDWKWRAAFLAGAILAPVLYLTVTGTPVPFAVPVSTTAMIIGGLIVGAGVTYSSGCTSGHGVCGMARLSPRSFVATLVFMVATFATVYVVRHVIPNLNAL
ncbi:MAG: YeeE/YedE thiosulfate transporter family protein [Nitratireductor sp.]